MKEKKKNRTIDVHMLSFIYVHLRDDVNNCANIYIKTELFSIGIIELVNTC